MKRVATWCLVAALALVSATGCRLETRYTARFVRYETLQDGTRVAVIVLTSPGSEQTTAYGRVRDLKPGELVLAEWVGRSWETPQWRPDYEVVSRAKR